MNRKFTARQVLQQGHKVDVFVLCVGGVKFGELHGLGKGGYAFFFNDQNPLVAWMDTDADAFTWTDLRAAMESAKRLWEQRDAASVLENKSAKLKAKADPLMPPKVSKPDIWVSEFMNGR